MTKLPTGRHTQTMKAARQNKKRYDMNKSCRSAAKTAVRKAREMAATDVKAAGELCREAEKKLDTAVTKGAMHKNKASRLKSRLRKAVSRSKVR